MDEEYWRIWNNEQREKEHRQLKDRKVYAVAYIRTWEDDDPQSEERQLKHLEQWSKITGVEIAKYYKEYDPGIKIDRPVLTEAIADVMLRPDGYKESALVVTDYDRFMRCDKTKDIFPEFEAQRITLVLAEYCEWWFEFNTIARDY